MAAKFYMVKLVEARSYIKDVWFDYMSPEALDDPIEPRYYMEMLWMEKEVRINYELGEYDKALKTYFIIRQRLPYYCKVDKAIANCYLYKGDYDEALKYYILAYEKWDDDDTASKHDPQQFTRMQIPIYAYKGNIDKVLEQYDYLCKEDKRNPIYFCKRACLQSEFERQTDAIKDLKHAAFVIKKPLKWKEEEIQYAKRLLSLSKALLEAEEQIKNMDQNTAEVKNVLPNLISFKKDLLNLQYQYEQSLEEIEKKIKELEETVSPLFNLKIE